ncbi:hypothetical protein STW0522CIT19_12650 [Citrobacter freundii]|nr:hypothetical protein STW0522CIT01_12650 [Citrobacter freundii]BBV34790.1 hypothetical protein STW0522CIT19_12650 [Citrobacter freundii]
MVKKISAARKAAESTIKHEDLVDAIENLGRKNGLDIEATEGNDERGDIRVNKKDLNKLIYLINLKLQNK